MPHSNLLQSYEEFLEWPNLFGILIKIFLVVKNIKMDEQRPEAYSQIISVATSPLVSVER